MKINIEILGKLNLSVGDSKYLSKKVKFVEKIDSETLEEVEAIIKAIMK